MLIYFREVDCSPFDIGLVYSTIARFADTDKFRFIQNIWKVDVGYEFPVLVMVSLLSLRIRSTSMALSVCRVFALIWSVERIVPGWISPVLNVEQLTHLTGSNSIRQR